MINSMFAENRNLERQLREKCENLEYQARRSNLLFFGVSEDTEESEETLVANIVKTDLQLPDLFPSFERAHRLGAKKENADEKPRPIIVKFTFFRERQQIWDARYKLKNSKFQMSEDFPREWVIRRKVLYKYFKAAKALKIKAIIAKDKLIIDGKVYSVNQLDDIPGSVKEKALRSSSVSRLSQE